MPRQTQTAQTTDSDERPVKGWQLARTQTQVDSHERAISGIDSKLDTIINLMNTRPTTAEVDAKIELAVKNAVEKQDLKYSPIVATNKKLLWSVVGSGLGIIASLVTLLIGVFTK